MKNSTRNILIVISLLCALVVIDIKSYLPENNFGNVFLTLYDSVGYLFAIALIILFGTTRSTKYGKLILAFLILTSVGTMFKILHLPGADLLLIIGPIGISIIYLFRFASKQTKGHLDVLKLLWVLSAYTIGPLIVLRFISREYLIVTAILFWLMLLDFIYLEFKKNSLTKT